MTLYEEVVLFVIAVFAMVGWLLTKEIEDEENNH